MGRVCILDDEKYIHSKVGSESVTNTRLGDHPMQLESATTSLRIADRSCLVTPGEDSFKTIDL